MAALSSAAQPQHRIGDLLRLDEAALRIIGREHVRASASLSFVRCGDAIDGAVEQRRFGKTRADRIDGDAGLGGFERQGAGQSDDAMLGGDIGRDIGIAFQAGGRGDEDDASPFFLAHAGERRLHREKRAGEIDVDDLVPKLVRNFLGRRAFRRSGIGDDDVEVAARRLRR